MNARAWASSPSRVVALAAVAALTVLCGSWRAVAIELVWGGLLLAFAVHLLPESVR